MCLKILKLKKFLCLISLGSLLLNSTACGNPSENVTSSEDNLTAESELENYHQSESNSIIGDWAFAGSLKSYSFNEDLTGIYYSSGKEYPLKYTGGTSGTIDIEELGKYEHYTMDNGVLYVGLEFIKDGNSDNQGLIGDWYVENYKSYAISALHFNDDSTGFEDNIYGNKINNFTYTRNGNQIEIKGDVGGIETGCISNTGKLVLHGKYLKLSEGFSIDVSVNNKNTGNNQNSWYINVTVHNTKNSNVTFDFSKIELKKGEESINLGNVPDSKSFKGYISWGWWLGKNGKVENLEPGDVLSVYYDSKFINNIVI